MDFMFFKYCLSDVNLSLKCLFAVYLMESDKFLKEYAWVNMGSQRREVLRMLPNTPFTTEKFRDKINENSSLNISLREMSRHLNSFLNKGFLKCSNPKAPYNKLYSITEKGKKIKDLFFNVD